MKAFLPFFTFFCHRLHLNLYFDLRKKKKKTPEKVTENNPQVFRHLFIFSIDIAPNLSTYLCHCITLLAKLALKESSIGKYSHLIDERWDDAVFIGTPDMNRVVLFNYLYEVSNITGMSLGKKEKITEFAKIAV